jgi:NAD(P)-dependent dehydrogenase (short-subunit alcohol dehydrogenase family)
MTLSAQRRNKYNMELQVCLVTGAAQGLGNEFCRAFMRS